MKKTFLLAGIALVAALASCNKSDIPDGSAEGIKINITVAAPGLETRAVKTGWSSGDRINLFFDKWNDGATGESFRSDPDMVLIYDGSKWFIEYQAESLCPGESGFFFALYEANNSLSSYALSTYYNNAIWYYAHNSKSKHTDYQDVYHYNQVISSDNIPYTFDGTVVTASITTWNTSDCKFKVLVKTDDSTVLSNQDNTVLQLQIGDAYAEPKGLLLLSWDYSFQVCPNARSGTANSSGMTGAVYDPEGLAFYYSSADATPDQEIKFTLIDAVTGEKKQYSASGKTLDSSAYTFKTVVVNYSNFTPAE
ncbi:MAG: hypothetical protein ACI399_04155 [Candidatus Cryptobacteroides sp.]